MNERRPNFLTVFLIEAGPSPELLAAFIIGLLVVGVGSNLVYALVTTPLLVLPVLWQPLLAIAGGTALAYFCYRLDRRHRSDVTVTFDEASAPPGHAGLIWLLGPGNPEHLLAALAHHRERGGARHCWLLMQSDNAAVQETFSELTKTVSATAGALADALPKERPDATRLHPIYLDQPDVQHTYAAVYEIYTREAREVGLQPEEVIADITGGFKPMTAGMVLGTLAGGRTMLEYVESGRDAEGRPIKNTAHVVKVDVNFFRSPATNDGAMSNGDRKN